MPAPIALNLACILHHMLIDPRGWRVEALKEEFGIADRTYRKYRGLLSEHFAFDKQWTCTEVSDGGSATCACSHARRPARTRRAS